MFLYKVLVFSDDSEIEPMTYWIWAKNTDDARMEASRKDGMFGNEIECLELAKMHTTVERIK